MIILISYDLNNYERPSAYEGVREMIEKYAVSTKKALFSQWFVETSDSVQTWSDRMKKVTDDDDHWFVVQIKAPYQGWLPRTFWTWLNNRVSG